MRVTIVGLNYLPEPTGIAPYTSGLAQNLNQRGHIVSVIAGYPHYPSWKVDPKYKGFFSAEWVGGVAVRRVRQYTPRAQSNLLRVLMELSFGLLANLRRWSQPDVVVCVSPALFGAALCAMRVRLTWRRPRLVIWTQDLYSRGVAETGGGRLAVTVAKVLESAILGSADAVVVIHDRFASYVSETLSVPEGRVRVIRNWAHLRDIERDERSVVRAKFGWSESEIVVLHAGNMGVKQGLENVVEAAKLLNDATSNVRFVFLGDGNQRQYLEDLAEGVVGLQFIRTLPEREFQSVLYAADILLVNELGSSVEMAVPSKLTSYFSTGLPVVAATNSGSTTAAEIEFSGAGLIVDPDDPSALLSAIAQLASSPDLSARLGAAGQKFQQTQLQADYAVDAFEDLFDDMTKPS